MPFANEYHVTVSGAGAHDGSSKANAWTFAEMIAAAPAAGSRINVYGDGGGYSEGATTLPSNGTAIAPIVLRGCHTTPGDLDNQGRGADGMLNTANMPDITITSAWTPSSFCYLQNLDITAKLSSFIITSTSVNFWGLSNCRAVNTQNNAAASVLRGNNYLSLTNCDFACTGASHGTIVEADINIDVRGCTFAATANGITLLEFEYGNVGSCAFLGSGNTSIAIDVVATLAVNQPLIVIDSCTFYGCGTCIRFPNAAAAKPVSVMNSHATDSAKFIDNLYSATSAVAVIEHNNRIRDVTTPRTGVLSMVLAAEVTTDAGDYTTDYISATNLRLKSTAAGKGVGMMPYSDIGAYQCAYPTLPTAANVYGPAYPSGYGYADAMITPTLRGSTIDHATNYPGGAAELTADILKDGETVDDVTGTYEGGGGGGIWMPRPRQVGM